MKIIWFSNHRFSHHAIKATGTWLKVMGEKLAEYENIHLYNITKGDVKSLVFEQVGKIQQYVVPQQKRNTYSLPNSKIVNEISNVVAKIDPDIIHIWGTESYWGLLSVNKHISGEILLEIQGLRTQIIPHLNGGLNFSELLKCTGFKELVKPKSHVLFMPKEHRIREKNELDIIRAHDKIGIQSISSLNIVSQINPQAKTFKSLIPLRDDFIENQNSWSFNRNNTLFTSVSSPTTYKGLHVLIRALYIVKQKNRNVQLRIAGNIGFGIRQSGYVKYLNRLINKLELKENIEWVGSIDSKDMVKELLNSDLSIIPSFVESYCLALYESIAIGVPVVCSYAGAMPEASDFTDRVHYFQPGDYYACAKLIQENLKPSNKKHSNYNNAIDANAAVVRQIEIYNAVLS